MVCRISVLLITAVALVRATKHEGDEAAALDLDDQCNAEDGGDCALNALQLRAGQESSMSAEALAQAAFEAEAAATSEAEAAELQRLEDQAEAVAEGARALLSPRHRYNSSAFGGRRAPAMATMYDGLEDERVFDVTADGDGLTHIFAVGDWGATMPGHYTAPNKRGPGQKCPQNCGYVNGIDNRAQLLVANVMKNRAGNSNPQYVLNVGDNFYWAGINEGCSGTHASGKTYGDFAAVWSGVYGNLANKPWISALGNHDYGGRQFNDGWPQQIGYSFVNRNWVMPGRYYNRVMHHPGFTVEYFVIDSNAYDAKNPEEDPEHNICSRQYNPGNANCAQAGGPTSVDSCKSWFWSTYNQQKGWLRGKLAASRAQWQILVTHFPCGHDSGYYRYLHQGLGLDFMVTGHRHDQELWLNSGALGGMSCIVTGGGGGITSEHPPGGMDSTQYGFFDLTMSRSKMKVELIALNGEVIRSGWVYPSPR